MLNLVRYEAARTALAECRAVDEVKDIRDKAVAMEAYARQAKDTRMMQDAAEIKVRAERRLGELIAQQKATVGLNSGQLLRGSAMEPREDKPTLADAGIDKKLSMRSQQLAAMPDDQFETTIATARDTAQTVSSSMLLMMQKTKSRHPPRKLTETDRVSLQRLDAVSKSESSVVMVSGRLLLRAINEAAIFTPTERLLLGEIAAAIALATEGEAA